MTEPQDISERRPAVGAGAPSRTGFAVGAFVLTAILLAIGAFSGSDNDVGYYLVALAIAAVATAVVFWIVIPRIRNLSTGALVLSIVAAITIIVFWLGLPVPLAAGAALLGLEARGRDPGGDARATIALVIAALVVAAAVVVAFVG
ncbi:MAG TPA: hypothetical protein VH281_04005 [Gaiellaceae bacterium]|jgi:hypothetical protein